MPHRTQAHLCSISHLFLHLFDQLSALCRRLDELWEENQGSEILFMWIQFLKEEMLEFLGIKSPLEISRNSKANGERRKTDLATKGSISISCFKLK